MGEPHEPDERRTGMSDDDVSVEPPEREGGPKAWLVLLGTAVAAAVVVGGVLAYQAWQDGDEDATAPTVGPGPDTAEPADDLDRGTFLFRRVTADGIEVRARLNANGGMFGRVIVEGDAGVAEEGVTEMITVDTAPAPTAPDAEGLLRVAPTTAPAADVPAATAVAAPIPIEPGIGGPIPPEDVPARCVVAGDLQAWAISSESVAQGGSPWMEVSPDDLYPQLMWDGMANQQDPDASSIVGVTLQVPDDVTTVRLRTMAGAMDEMEPVEGAVALAVLVPAQAVQDALDGGMNDPATRNSMQITAQRADGTVLTASVFDAMNKPHPAWGAECQPGVIIDPMPPPEPAPPALPEPGEAQPADPAAARAEIERNFAVLYGPADPAVERAQYIDDNYGMAEARDEVERNFPGASDGSSVAIEELVFVDATNAVFVYDLDTPTVDFPNQIGRARLVDGVWKITRGTLCQDLSHGGGTCPP